MLAGTEMIYELAILIADYITTNNSAAVAARPSFHQQMVDRELADQQADQEREQANRRKQMAAYQEEQEDLERRIEQELVRKQQQMLSEQQRQHHLSSIADAVHSVAGRWAENIQLLEFDHSIHLDPKHSKGRFTTVALEESSVHDPLCTIYDAYPTDLVDASSTASLSDRFTVQCFTVTSLHYLADQGRKQLEKLQSRINDLVQIRHHNLVSVYGCRLEYMEEHSQSPTGIRLWVLSDSLPTHDGSTLEDILGSCGMIAIRQTTAYIRHILLALVSLHAAGFIHRSIIPGNILLAKEGRNRFVAQLFNTSYREELIELHRLTPLSEAIGDGVGNDIRVAPEVLERSDLMGRKNDIWCVGVLGLQMALGLDVLGNVEIGQEHDVLETNRHTMSTELYRILSRMLTVDHRQRPTAMELLNDPFFNQGAVEGELPVQKLALDSASRGLTFELQKTAAKQKRTDISVPPPPTTSTTVMNQLIQPSASRYQTDFEELEFIGKGGFGSVVKARNRIDGRYYAIKKIELDARDPEGNKKIFREVTTLSRLHHQYVVRYYTTWVEDIIEVPDELHPVYQTSDGGSSFSDWSTSSDEGEEVEEAEEEKATTGSSKSGDSRRNVFSAIRFGTMGKSTGKDSPRGVALFNKNQKAVREFTIDFGGTSPDDSTEGELQSQSQSDLEALLLQEQQQQQKHPFDQPKSKKKKKKKSGKILYIQMEYCKNKTLNDVINEGLDEKESWRLFGQILEGLHHIHQSGVIHRDLKPVNTFLDGNADIKIGDFGLATSSFAPIDQAMASQDRSQAEDAMTADIGTSTYVAPEVIAKSSGGGTRYNQKVDMYSLGIIFFEMCYPLGTGMERAQVLHNLRKPEIQFPADFPVDRMQLQYQIIKRLLNHTPRHRMSSAELLESDLLPPRLEEDEYIRETIRTIANPSQPYFTKLMESLFAHRTSKHIDATFDFRSNDIQTEQLNTVFLDRIRDRMTRVFRIHAAVELSTPAAMTPQQMELLDMYQRPAVYLDSRGNVVQLPYDQTVPFARYVARTKMTEIKRYCFDRYFVANSAGGQPISHQAACFDAVTNRSAHAVAAAEVISVTCEVFEELPAFQTVPMTLVMNHMVILDAVLAYCGIMHPEWVGEEVLAGKERHGQFVRNLCYCLRTDNDGRLNMRQRIQKMSQTMGVKVPGQSLDRLQQFADIRGDLASVQREVMGRLGSVCGMQGTRHASQGAEYAHRVVAAFQELRYVEATFRHFGVAIPCVYDPLFNHHYAYYEGGYCFQLVTSHKRRDRQVLAEGGRYDGLLNKSRHLAGNQSAEPSASFATRIGSIHSTDVWREMYRKTQAGISIGTDLSSGCAVLGTAQDVVCVGVQIHLDLAIQEMSVYQQQILQSSSQPTFGLWTRKRCDVVVASFGTRPLLRERIALARELWAGGLPTDFLFNDDPEMTMEGLMEICQDQGMNWVVTLKPRRGGYRYKVKNILRRVECEVAREELTDWLQTDIKEQMRLDQQVHESMPAAAASSGTEVVTGSAASRLEVVLVNPQQQSGKNLNRSKHKQKLMMTERAITGVSRCINEVKVAPILAVDVGAELLHRIVGQPSSILADLGYKRVMEACSAHQRAYLVELRSHLERLHRENVRHVWLYSVKDDLAVTYKL